MITVVRPHHMRNRLGFAFRRHRPKFFRSRVRDIRLQHALQFAEHRDTDWPILRKPTAALSFPVQQRLEIKAFART